MGFDSSEEIVVSIDSILAANRLGILRLLSKYAHMLILIRKKKGKLWEEFRNYSRPRFYKEPHCEEGEYNYRN